MHVLTHLSRKNQLDQSINHVKGCWLVLFTLIPILRECSVSGGPDQKLHHSVSDQGLHYFHMSHKKTLGLYVLRMTAKKFSFHADW